MRLLGYDDDNSPYLALPVVVLVACLVLLITGAAMFLRSGRAGGEPQARAYPSSEPAGCAGALEAAQEALENADRLDAALVQQAELMNDLRAGRITPAQALERGAASLVEASRASVALDVSRSRYDTELRTCHP